MGPYSDTEWDRLDALDDERQARTNQMFDDIAAIRIATVRTSESLAELCLILRPLADLKIPKILR